MSKDGKKIQASGKAGETKTAAMTTGKPVDVKKSHEAETFKSMDATLPDQADSDDRLQS